MKFNELTRLLTKAGCFVEKHGAGHDYWRSVKTGKATWVPRHGTKEVPTGLLKSIKRDLLGH